MKIFGWLWRQTFTRVHVLAIEASIAKLAGKVEYLSNYRHLVKSDERKERLTREWIRLSTKLHELEQYSERLRKKIAGTPIAEQAADTTEETPRIRRVA